MPNLVGFLRNPFSFPYHLISCHTARSGGIRGGNDKADRGRCFDRTKGKKLGVEDELIQEFERLGLEEVKAKNRIEFLFVSEPDTRHRKGLGAPKGTGG